MNVKTYAPAPAPGQPNARQAKKIAHKLGLTDLTLNRNGIWNGYDNQLNLIKITPEMVQQLG